MEVEFQKDSQTVEEMGYAIIERANKIHKQGNEDAALRLRVAGRELIEKSRKYNGGEDFAFEEGSLYLE